MGPLPFLLCSLSLDELIQAYDLVTTSELRTPRSLSPDQTFS